MKNHFIILITLVGLLGTVNSTSGQESAKKAAPLKVLLVAGGCCHDYATQTQLLKNGIEQRINAVVTIVYNPDTKTDATFKIYESDDWAKGYDVVVHDECTSAVTDKPYLNRILTAHKNGLPAVNLHCAMHSYRSGNFREPVELGADNALWYEMLGVQSTAHGPKVPIDVSFADHDHAITKGMEDWTTIDEELYNNVRVFAGTTVLASGKQFVKPNKKELKQNPNAEPREVSAVVAWTNEYGPKKTKIFSTSLGHNNGTVGDDRYLELVTRGLLWATGNLTAEGTPTAALETVSAAQPRGIDALTSPSSPLAKDEVIAFFGDSITQGGAGPGGYCRLIGEAIEKQRPELGVKIVYAGISGHKVPDLQGRLDRDVLSKNPTIVFIYIGINDVWHSTSGRGTSKDRFDAGLRDLIDKITATGARVVLCTPSTIGEKTDGSNSLDPMLEEYSAISRKVAADTGVTLCDLRREFLDHLKKHNPDNKERGILTGDGVHLNAAGNQFVAAQAAEAIAQSLKKSEPVAETSHAKSTSLFNGKDLSGWHVDIPHLDKNPDADATFIVRDGMLVSLGNPMGHLISDATYKNYRLEVEYRFAGKPGNCGVLVHASTPRALYKMFPKSIECQMNHQHAGDFWCIVEDITVPDMVERRGPKEKWGITEGANRRILNLTDGSEKPVGQWNTMVIECVGDAVKVWVNGEMVNHGTGCTASEGQIALQAEGSEVEFRKLELTPITKLTE